MRCRGRRITCFAADDISPAQTTAIELLYKPVMRYCHCMLHIAGAGSLPEDDRHAYCTKPHMDMPTGPGRWSLRPTDRSVISAATLTTLPRPQRQTPSDGKMLLLSG